MKIAKRLSAIVLAVALVLIFLPEQVVKAGNSSAAKLKNPVHHCDTDNMYEKDYSTYSYVYFGSYPQTEVKNADIISQIDANLSGSGDTWVNGIKYRKVNYIDSNYSRFFDEGLEGDKETAYRYFKWEPIKYTIRFDGNGADSGAMNSITCEYNKAVIIPYAAYNKNNWRFKFWNTKPTPLDSGSRLVTSSSPK